MTAPEPPRESTAHAGTTTSNLAPTAAHELAHALVGRAQGLRRMPRSLPVDDRRPVDPGAIQLYVARSLIGATKMEVGMRRIISIAILSAMAVMAFAAPATATVHEITGMFCADGHGNPFPPGLSGGSNADNFAKPLFANGFIESVEPYAGDGVNGPGVLISFDFDHPASKLAPLPGTFFFGDGTYVTAFELDSSHGFTNCVVLR